MDAAEDHGRFASGWGGAGFNTEVRMALTLSRKLHQILLIDLPDGRTIVVDYAQRQGDKIRLRMDAPPDVRIRRGELQERKEATHEPH